MSMRMLVEDYRPHTLDDYVFRDEKMRQKVEHWVADKHLPHLLFSGGPGTGKTSLGLLLLDLLGIPKGDRLIIPASRERKIETIQDKVMGFVSTWPLGPTGIKYVFLDEADAMSPLAQKFLRTEMETYEDMCRFVMTCNYPNKIIPAIHSRVQHHKFTSLDYDDFTTRAGEILMKEGVEFEIENLIAYVNSTYPDLRKCINLLSQSTLAGKLEPFTVGDTGGKDYLIEMADLFKAGRFYEARKLIVEQAQPEEYPEIYRFFYQNLAIWGDTPDEQDEALLAIRRGIVNHSMVADVEINLAATCVELSRIRN